MGLFEPESAQRKHHAQGFIPRAVPGGSHAIDHLEREAQVVFHLKQDPPEGRQYGRRRLLCLGNRIRRAANPLRGGGRGFVRVQALVDGES
jgi:hypothetical protein